MVNYCKEQIGELVIGGHVKVSMDNKRLCTCGLFDCYEAYASGIGLAETAREILANISPDQSPLAKDIQNLKNADIFEAANKNDIVAKQIINLWHKHLVAGMVSITHVLNPNCFVLSGGLSKFIDYEMLSELLADSTIPQISENLKIYRSDLGDYAGITGAAQLILDKLANTIH